MNQWNIAIKAGETLRETVKIKQNDGSPVDITGATAVCQIRKTAKSVDVLASPTITIIDGANGEMQVLLAAATTGLMPTTGITCAQEDSWVWDAFITYIDTSVECLWDEAFKISPRVTQNE